MLDDAEIAALTPQERRDLIVRLSRPADEIVHPRAQRARELWVGALALGAGALALWIVFLVLTLPREYKARNWDLTWTGFDLLLLTMVVSTAVLAYRRRQVVALSGFATAMLLVCDAWFDVVTAHGHDRLYSVLSAVVVEIPTAAALVFVSFRVLRLAAIRNWAIPTSGRVWDIKIPLPSGEDPAVRRTRRQREDTSIGTAP
ncbi:hypothetical protein GCM10027596_12510 [Nocardioides korecus]